MNRTLFSIPLLTALLLGINNGKTAFVTVDPATLVHGYMNVVNLPSSGTFPSNPYGVFSFGSAWGLTDLPASFSKDPSSTTNIVTLSPNIENDPNCYWYQNPSVDCSIAGSSPGAIGNKIMDAALYAEYTGVYTNQNLTFTGVVYSNVLLKATSTNQQGNGWQCFAFIRDFVANYSSYTTTAILLTNTGAFSITLHTSSDAGHHIQWGFETFGPDVWPTDPILPRLGQVVVASNPYIVAGVSVTNLTATGASFTNKQFRFTLTGPAGSNAVIAASTNLLIWTPLVTNPLGSGTLTFTDAVATNFPRRFYRATLRP